MEIYKREVVVTSDGSSTLRLLGTDECYHSINGAMAESLHIFIKCGLERYLDSTPVKIEKKGRIVIFEAGLGTGLNALLTYKFLSEARGIAVDYIAMEKYPITCDEMLFLNYTDIIGKEYGKIFNTIHSSEWERPTVISPLFSLTKVKDDFKSLADNSCLRFIKEIDVVFYDAFSPVLQPSLWSYEIFQGIYNRMSVDSLLVTYSSKGSVKRALREAGFEVIRMKGPAGKRHITLALRSCKS